MDKQSSFTIVSQTLLGLKIRTLMDWPNGCMSSNQEKEALNLLTYMSLSHQHCVQSNGQKQLGEDFDEDLLELQHYCGLKVNLQLD